jgi:hypothetical protein
LSGGSSAAKTEASISPGVDGPAGNGWPSTRVRSAARPADRSTKTCSTLGAVAVLFFRLDHEVREVVNTA